MTERNGWIACFETARSSTIKFDMPFGFHQLARNESNEHKHQITPAAFPMTQIHKVYSQLFTLCNLKIYNINRECWGQDKKLNLQFSEKNHFPACGSKATAPELSELEYVQ